MKRTALLTAVAVLAATALRTTIPAVATPASGCETTVVGKGFTEHAPTQVIAPSDEVPDGAMTVPTWSGSFTTDGVTYPFDMVGSDPAAGSATTTVPVVVVPVRIAFAAGGCTLGDDAAAARLAASPLFAPTPFATGTTQYLDAIERGSLWSQVGDSSPGWHVLLGAASVAPPQTLQVPAAQGVAAFSSYTQRPFGVVAGKWFYLRTLELLKALHVDPGTLVLVVPYNTYLTDESPASCLGPSGCGYYVGYHDAVLSDRQAKRVSTYAVASALDYGRALPPGLDLTAEVASHEVLEWANDPFDHGRRVRGQPTFFANAAPPWSSPYDQGSGTCNRVLEVADPVEAGPLVGARPPGSSTTYLLANAVFLSWFARESPSTAIGGRYDALGTLSSYSEAC